MVLGLLQSLEDWFDVSPGLGVETNGAGKSEWSFRVRNAMFHGISPMISGDHREISVSLEAKIAR
jgi:hypothetical protein